MLCIINAVKLVGLVRTHLFQRSRVSVLWTGLARVCISRQACVVLYERRFTYNPRGFVLWWKSTLRSLPTCISVMWMKIKLPLSGIHARWSSLKVVAVITGRDLSVCICFYPAGSSRFDWSDWTPWGPRREGRPRFARASGFSWWQGRQCKWLMTLFPHWSTGHLPCTSCHF